VYTLGNQYRCRFFFDVVVGVNSAGAGLYARPGQAKAGRPQAPRPSGRPLSPAAGGGEVDESGPAARYL
jgi:hypothetical protein